MVNNEVMETAMNGLFVLRLLPSSILARLEVLDDETIRLCKQYKSTL